MTCLAGLLISSADPTAWSSRMVLSSETQQTAEQEAANGIRWLRKGSRNRR
jgi:hypothetical protein